VFRRKKTQKRLILLFFFVSFRGKACLCTFLRDEALCDESLYRRWGVAAAPECLLFKRG